MNLPVTDPITVLLILLATSLIVPFIARLIRLPDIAVLILAGVALGPYGGGVMMRTEAIGLFASMGLLFLMFLAGIDVDIREYRKNSTKSLIFGILTFAIPTAVSIPVGMFVLNMTILEAILLSSLLASHTLIAYPVLTRLRIVGNEVVGITVGGTIIATVASLIVLSVIVSLHGGDVSPVFIIIMFAKLVVFMAFMVILLPRIAAWGLKKLEGDGKLQFLFVTVILFSSALLSGLAGVEPIIGAFMSGIALGRSVPAVSPLGNRLEFFGNTIFIPSFLISVGMLVDIRIIFSDIQTVLVASVMTGVVLATKWLSAFISQKVFSWDWVRRELVFGLSIGQAAGTLAVSIVGYNLGIFGIEIVNGGIVMILIIAIISPLVVQFTGRRIAGEESPAHSEQDLTRRKILIGIQEPSGSKEKGRVNERLLELSLLLHDPKGITDMRAVTVLDSNRDMQKRVEAVEKHLSEYSKGVVAAGHKIDFGPRIASNVAMGLANGANEFIATDIVIGLGQSKFPFRSGMDAVLSDLSIRSGKRILAARLSSPLATTSRVSLFLPKGIDIEEDFEGTLLSVKIFIRQNRAELTCYGSALSLKHAREIFDATPSLAGITWEECDQDNLCRLIKKNDGLSCILLARQNGASWSRDMKQVKHVIEKLPNSSQMIVFCPAVEQPEGGSVTKTIPGAIGRLWSKLNIPRLQKGKKEEKETEKE